jgi:hypothetical protein
MLKGFAAAAFVFTVLAGWPALADDAATLPLNLARGLPWGRGEACG